MAWFAKCNKCGRKTRFPTNKGSRITCDKCKQTKLPKLNTNIYDYKYDEPIIGVK